MSSNLDNQSIYDIFRACRLCGAGGGYKMPIIPSVAGFDCADIELPQKIRECVQIEVHQEDKMPPLICELCVDKVNDFYEFLEMCRQTNTRTRLRLGLPPQTLNQGTADGDCILGVTEQIYPNRNPDQQPPGARPKQTKIKKEGKKEKKREEERKRITEVGNLKDKLESFIIKHEADLNTNGRKTRGSARDDSEDTQPSNRSKNSQADNKPSVDNTALNRIKEQKKAGSPKPKSILKKSMKPEESEDDLLVRSKRSREKVEKESKQDSTKKIKLTIRLRSPTPPRVLKPRPGPKFSKAKAQERETSPDPHITYSCNICSSTFRSSQGRYGHVRQVHSVGYTSNELACNACGEWFPTEDATMEHHKWHKNRNKAYRCRGCRVNYKSIHTYTEHVEKMNCVPWVEVPDVKCERCFKEFPTKVLLGKHRCSVVDARSKGKDGGKCRKCDRTYQSAKSLRRHEKMCFIKKNICTTLRKEEVKINPNVESRLMPAQVRMARCDPVLSGNKCYNVCGLPDEFGLDSNCIYPYRSFVRVKTEPLTFDGMVSIGQEIKEEFYVEEDYVHWDSDCSSDSDEEYSLVNPTEKKKKVPSLTTLSLKTLYSKRCLGKVPKKLRKVKKFESLFNMDFANVQSDINNIIDNLIDDINNTSDDKSETVKVVEDDGVKVDDCDDRIKSANVEINDSSQVNYDSDSLLQDHENNDKCELVETEPLPNNDPATEPLKERVNAEDIGKTSNEMEMDASSDETLKKSKGIKNNDSTEKKVEAIKDKIDSTVNLAEERINGSNSQTNNLIQELNDLNTEIDDKKLMDELNKQIGENENKEIKEGDRITLEDLVPSKHDMNLDNVSDEEFNFDA